MADLDWRVEVTVSTGSLQRVFKPRVFLSLSLLSSNNDSPTGFSPPLQLEASREEFQRLRFRVAAALKAMEDTEALPILRIE